VEEGRKSGNWFGNFNFGVKKEDVAANPDAGPSQVADKPPQLKGWLEKKGKGKFTSEWQSK
jgi:hypothetical protein